MKRRFRFAPLSGGYMAASMLGIWISLMYVYNRSPDFGVTFALVFFVMFIASIISMTVADHDEFIELEKKKK